MDSRYCSSIPQNVIAAIDVRPIGDLGPPGSSRPRFDYIVSAFVKNGHLLIVQSEDIPSLVSDDVFWASSYDEKPRLLRDDTALLSERLSVIASYVDTIDFEKVQYAILVPDGSSQRLVGQLSEEIPPFSAPFGWLPRVQESDVQVIQWMSLMRLRCLWNGRQVEVFLPDSFSRRWMIQQVINVVYLFGQRSIDITFEPLALVVRGTEIIGLMMAKTEGRFVELRDRALVYDTFAKLHKANIVYDGGISTTGLMIQNNKLRFTQCMHMFVADDAITSDMRQRNWQDLDKLFEDIPGQNELLLLDPSKLYTRPTLLGYIPDPERLFFDWTMLILTDVAATSSRDRKREFSRSKTVSRHRPKVSLADNHNSGSLLPIPSYPHKNLSYHPYRFGANTSKKNILLVFSEPTVHYGSNSQPTRIISKRQIVSRGKVRAVSVDSDRDVEDDATLVGDDEKWSEVGHL
ncbi:hypothetical protein BDP27DRAFT_1416268 [Rhodocollybia butyracea]|uniref:Uncharacterized protein n=1 Tax=Rhodocollybia butyracea TaxID=206335 RepID=A0A9P5UBR1_9AGAR|nr:hypothetical protein BDP27DRAFT_1416268 [Rhodocollybia butyracea]